ncbi:ABC transporter ATP-binding protein [Stigmatella aurantiaca]|uniref:ABC transporter, ATP-binding protein n=1 Tax=Stigmatella aurantiaca (strain DW4/3-1) TaxID=378806 RepID=Q08X01_STIAD|nr:ABC transporter ATP-binding protein [Stigmatella aurantiaca]ADO74998.1 ABC transporter, ATP-binding protein [Stigmatella aurantiaca DW4/3-1]EAU65016.1 ABC-type transport protein [Stigmatella aurantiaca DW4/3-1]
MSLLEVKGLRRDYGALRAVDDVSFELEAGTILGFIGPNGAGKSTTMRILATLDAPTQGEVLLDGRSLVDAPDQARPLIGYMPDRYGTYDDVTVWEFLDFFARAYGLKGAVRRQRVASVMDFTGLHPLKDKLTSALSKGMKQRVALGRTLLHDPKLLILDEPADGLDPRARIELRELLRALADQGKAVLISSHILTELAEICDTCAIIEQGRLLATGNVAELLARSAGHGAELLVRLAVGAEGDAAYARAERLLLEQPGLDQVTHEAGGLRVRLTLEPGATPAQVDEVAARLLAVLVGAGVPVCAFSHRQLNLEDAFMTVTKGRVA